MNSDEVKSNVTRLTCIGLGYLAGRWHLSGDTIIAIASDAGAAAAFVYGAVQHRGMIKVTENAKVVVTAALLALLLALPAPATAADLVVLKAPKAAPAPACTLQSCSGLFGGINIGNSGGNLDIIGTGLSGLASNGMMLGGQAGAEFWNGQFYAAARLLADYNVTLNAPASGISDQFSYGMVGSLGYSLAAAFGAVTTTAAPVTLPQQLLSSLMTPYVNMGFLRRHNQTGLVSGAGIEALLANNWTLNADYYHIKYGSGSASALATLTDENIFLLSVNRHFASSWFGL